MELDVDELVVTQVTKPWLKHVTPYHEVINLNSDFRNETLESMR